MNLDVHLHSHGKQTCMVNNKGRDMSAQGLRLGAASVDAPAQTVREIIEEVNSALAEIKTHLR